MSELSTDLKVACEIWHFQAIGERIWYSKLIESLSWCMNKNDISHSILTLCDWGIVFGEYGATEKGRAGRLWFIDTHDDGDFRIRDLYDKHWKEQRKTK